MHLNGQVLCPHRPPLSCIAVKVKGDNVELQSPKCKERAAQKQVVPGDGGRAPMAEARVAFSRFKDKVTCRVKVDLLIAHRKEGLTLTVKGEQGKGGVGIINPCQLESVRGSGHAQRQTIQRRIRLQKCVRLPLSTRSAPVCSRMMTAALITTYVTGFIAAEMRPTAS